MQYTDNLKLFKYEPEKDGKEVFSIQKALNDNWDIIDKGIGGGLDVGFITIAPFGVDESENKYRYLNGQLLIQDQYPAFTKWVKNKQLTNPSAFVDEETWLLEKAASKLGQCGKFVINDTDGTIRIPCVINIQGLTDLASVGNMTMDLNASSSTYQDNAPVQQEAIQYPYVICVNSGVEEAEKPINNYQVNNVYSFGMSQYYKGTMNNASWLRSEGQWNAGTVYTDLYTWIQTQITNNVNGFKNSTATGITDYDWVINTTNQTFRLPLKNGQEGVFASGYNLYYYVGDTLQNVDIMNVARIEETLVDKTDKVQAAKASMPSNRYDDLTLGASGSTYIAPANGWVNLRLVGATKHPMTLVNQTTKFQSDIFVSTGSLNGSIFIPVRKNDIFLCTYGTYNSKSFFRFFYAEGEDN